MATAYSSTSNGYRLRLVYNQASQNIPANTSVVSWSLYIENGTNTFSTTSTGSLSVNGSTQWSVSGTVTQLSNNSSLLLDSGTLTVAHASDGTKTVPFSANFQTTNQTAVWRVPPLSVSASLSLTRIPRGPKVAISGSYQQTVAYAAVGGSWQTCLVYVAQGGSWVLAA